MIFEYSEHSPSCLIWKVDRLFGRNYSQIKIKAGSNAGSVSKNRWKVTFKINGQQKTFDVSRIVMELHGVKLEKSLEVDHKDGNSLNNKIENLRVVTRTINQRNKKIYSSNKTGVCGVQNLNVKGRSYLVATWRTSGIKKSKCFSVDNLGYEIALQLAIEFRNNKIIELNDTGAGYTNRHGKN